MQYIALVLSVVGAVLFLALLLAALCSYYWISKKHYPCAWSATSDVKSDVYYKKTTDWKFVPNGTVPDPEEGVSNDNDEPLLSSLVLDEGAGSARTPKCDKKKNGFSADKTCDEEKTSTSHGPRKCRTSLA